MSQQQNIEFYFKEEIKPDDRCLTNLTLLIYFTMISCFEKKHTTFNQERRKKRKEERKKQRENEK